VLIPQTLFVVHEFLDLGIDLQNGPRCPLNVGLFLLLVLSIIILVIFVARSNIFGILSCPPALFGHF